MIVEFGSIPLEDRAQAAYELIRRGEMRGDDALAGVVWGFGDHLIDPEKEILDSCANGHLLDSANRYVDPHGRVKCRACAREYKRKNKHHRYLEECSQCGNPCTKSMVNGRAPLCRKCWYVFIGRTGGK